MRVILTLLAVLFAILFVVVAPLAVFASSLDRDVLSAERWRTAIEESHSYSALASASAMSLRQEGQSPFAQMSDAQLDALMATLLPEDQVKPVIDEIVEQMVAYGRAEREDVSVSMRAFKAGIVERFPAALNAAMAGLPICASQREFGPPFNCRPRPEDQAEFDRISHEAATRAWGASPDTYTFPPVEAGPSAEQRDVHRGLMLAIRVLPVLAAVLLVLVGACAVRGARGLLAWIGAPLLVAGLATIVLWTAVHFGIPSALAELRAEDPDNIGQRLAAPSMDLIVQGVARTLLLWGAMLGTAGLGMSIASLAMPRNEPHG